MSFPTILGPWFVVVRLAYDTTTESESDVFEGVEYYTSAEDDGRTFQDDPRRAMLFMSLHAAARVAAAEVAWVRVLTTKEEAQEFGRD